MRMKNFTVFGIVILLVLSTFISGAVAESGIDVPDEVLEYIEERYGGWEIDNYILIDGTPKGDYIFVIISSGKSRTMIGFRESNGIMKKYFVNSDALPQGEGWIAVQRHEPGDYISQGNTAVTYQDTYGFSVWRIAYDTEEHPAETVDFHLSDGIFKLDSYCKNWDNMAYVTDDGVSFYWSTIETYYGTVQGTIQRDIRYMSFSALPKDFDAAKAKLTTAPSIPDGNFHATEIQFTGGKKYAVYSAPDESSLRAANGKAVVSTNDWIQVFGQEDDYILIQYAISSDHMRFGYIASDALPKGTEVSELIWENQQAYLPDGGELTDDPLYSKSAIFTLPSQSLVTLLGYMDEWAYVEYSGTTWCRGFISADALKFDRDVVVTSLVGDELSGSGVFSPFGDISLDLYDNELPDGTTLVLTDEDDQVLETFTTDLIGHYALQSTFTSEPQNLLICVFNDDNTPDSVLATVTIQTE